MDVSPNIGGHPYIHIIICNRSQKERSVVTNKVNDYKYNAYNIMFI